MIKLEKINKSYPLKSGKKHHALKNINLEFQNGEFIAIVGRSGSGKTTLLNILGNLDSFDSGRLFIDGIDSRCFGIENWDSYRNQRIGFIFQQFYLIPYFTVYENVELPLLFRELSKEERRTRVFDIIQKVGLTEHMNKKPGYLSGGEQQRVVIARAMINDPDILLADEPTGQLDQKTAKEIMDLIKSVGEDKLVILVTHMDILIASYASRVIKIKDGSVQEDLVISQKITEYKSKPKSIKITNKNLIYLIIQNLKRKIKSSLLLMGILCFAFSLVLSMVFISQKNFQNDIYQFLASDVPMNLVKVSDGEGFSSDEIENLKNISNVQTVIPAIANPIVAKVEGKLYPFNEYEFLPESLNEFYLQNSLVCGSYPRNPNEVILNIKSAIAIVDENQSLYSRYDSNLVSDEDIWELVKDKRIEIINENEQAREYVISGIVNNNSWIYSKVSIYFHIGEINYLVGESVPIKDLNIYLVRIDEKSRSKTINEIVEVRKEYIINQDNIDLVNGAYERFNQLIKFVNTVFLILIFISVISIISLMNYYLSSRAKDVGILKSLGVSRAKIKTIFSLEYLLISITGILFSYFLSSLFIYTFLTISNEIYSSTHNTGLNNIFFPDLFLFLLVGFSETILMFLSFLFPIHNVTKKPVVDILKN